MARNLKALGLALVAAFAISAVVASGASAQQGELTSDGPVTLTGTQTGEQLANAWTMFGETIICPGSTFTGHKYITQHETETDPGLNHALIEPGATTFTVTPHYADCTLPGTTVRHVVIDMNGCDYVYHVGETTGGEHTYGVTTDIVCPPNQKIKWTIWNQATSMKICEYTFGAQTGLSGAHLKHTTSLADDTDLEGKFEGIHAEKHGLCLFGGTSTTSTIQLHVDYTLKGHTERGAETEVTISH